MLVELAEKAGRVLSCERVLRQVWREKNARNINPMRTVVSNLRRKLDDDADNPTYIFTEPRVGYRMPEGKE